jgi:uncharacterized protein (TIGR02466 family)
VAEKFSTGISQARNLPSGMKNIQNWFPTFIYYAALRRTGGAAFNRELLKECYQVRDFDLAGRKWSVKNYPGGYTSYASMAQLHRFSSTFSELEKKISRHVATFARSLEMDLSGRKLEMTDCWVNIMPTRVAHSLHLHPLSTISGTYYVRTPANSSTIKFEDPRLSRFMAAPPKIANASTAHLRHVTYRAEASKLILFESWLRHEVGANPATTDRVSISFNYNWF